MAISVAIVADVVVRKMPKDDSANSEGVGRGMNAEIIELNDDETPGEPQKVDLGAVPRIGELVAAGDRYFEVVNVVYRIDVQTVSVYVRQAKRPYEKRKAGFGFAGW